MGKVKSRMYEGPMDKDNVGEVCMEGLLGRAGESNGGK